MMQTKYLTTLAAASILSLGLVAGCANPPADTTSSPADTTQAAPTNSPVDTTNTEVDTTNSPASITNSTADTTKTEVEVAQSSPTPSTDQSIELRFYTENGVAIR
ncbi:MAG: hypothetical protein F6K41_18040, partial [Symploca sp. SIO3E6]|nr:hypothetical protein [Caldora sp. SIO3E6]